MTIETQAIYLEIINQDFIGMKNMLDVIQKHITEFPVYTQLEFIKPLKHMVVEAFLDACNPDDKFLNQYDGGESAFITI